MPKRHSLSNIHVFPDSDAFYNAAAEFWISRAKKALAAHGSFFVALSGGRTPAGLYRVLASPAWRDQIDWSKVVFFLGDERFVSRTDEQSNYKMIMETLIQELPVDVANIRLMYKEHDTAEAMASEYAESINGRLPLSDKGVPIFDLIMLGMGSDGHTASLFPGTAILNETKRSVAAVYVEKMESWRVSFTYPLINQARQVMVLVTGEDKADTLSDIFQDNAISQYPIQQIQPAGEMHWFIDQAAAAKLPAGIKTE